MSASEFYRLTPRLFGELVRQWHNEHRERLELVTLLRADIINFSMCHPKDRVEIADLLPRRPAEVHQIPAKRRRMTAKRREEVAGQIRKVMASLGA